jgi:hypothetical protein
MKVDHPRTLFSLPVTSVAAAANPAAQPADVSACSKDLVGLSSDLRLADEAVRAVALAGAVRPEAVARARALLTSGELAGDLERLADRLIESLIECD